MEIKKNITVKEIEKLKPGTYYSEDKLVKVNKIGNGYWTKITYDKKNDWINTITTERSDGSWNKRTYDEKGNQLTYINSDGWNLTER